MRAQIFQKALAMAILGGLTWMGANVLAQNPGSANATPQLTPPENEIVTLSKAKISDDVVVSYIRNSAQSYNLTAAQILYLRDQGISDAVIQAMLNHSAQLAQPTQAAPPATLSMPTTPAPPVDATAYAQPADTTDYNTGAYYDYGYNPYYYPIYDYSCWPPVIVSWGWGWGGGGYWGGWRGGWHYPYYYHGGNHAWHGGYGGGWHGGTVSHGGFSSGAPHGGGFSGGESHGGGFGGGGHR
jgi:hypothetical protein